MFDPFFSPSSGPSQPSASDIFDPFGTSAFSAPTGSSTTQQPLNQSEEDDFFAMFTTSAPPSVVQHDQRSTLSPEEKMKEDLRKLREVYQLEDAAAVSSRSMDESDDDAWTPSYYGNEDMNSTHYFLPLGERNSTVTASNLNLPLEGRILARLSTRSLITKDWDEAFWVISHGTLYVYRNEYVLVAAFVANLRQA